MVNFRNTLGRLWFLIVMVLVAANLILLSFHVSAANSIGTGTVIDMPDGSFKVRLATASKNAGKNIGASSRSLGRSAGEGVGLAARSVTSGLSSAAGAVSRVTRLVTDVDAMGSFIRPVDRTRPPVIVPVADVLPAPAVGQLSSVLPSADKSAPQWPIHGVITTEFGASDLPYQRVHTGLDISDGRIAGATPVRPFEPGQVADVIRSGGLGNHIVIDHGDGISSVYGHLSSIAVQVGQQVDEGTVLGYEGSTGASTGTHLHFETRVNGQPVDPHQFVGGQP